MILSTRYALQRGSTYEIWFAATIAGPVVGAFSRPITLKRNTIRRMVRNTF